MKNTNQRQFEFYQHMKKLKSNMVTEFFLISDITDGYSLNIFIKKSKEYISGKVTLIDIKNILGETIQDFSDIKETAHNNYENNEIFKEYINLIKEILIVLYEIEEVMEEEEFTDDLTYLIEELNRYNNKLIEVRPDLSKIQLSEKQIIDGVIKKIPEEEFSGGNYGIIKNMIQQFLKGDIGKEKVNEVLVNMLRWSKKCKKEYNDSTYITDKEWTLETYIGDKFLLEGIEDWEKGLASLYKNYFLGDEKLIDEALDTLYNANRKVLITQYLAEYMKYL